MSTSSEELFALTEVEKRFTPDDWAWQFLRLNSEYQDAYRRASEVGISEEALNAIKSHLADASNVRLATASGSICTRDFGLAAWLDPVHEKLPELTDGGSWFFPLKRVVQEDPRLVDVGATGLGQIRTGPQRPLPYPRLAVDETPFGYGKPKLVQHCDTPHPERIIWVALDCSVPPDGQISALRTLARMHRKFWQKDSQTTDVPTTIIKPVTYEDVFSRVTFTGARAAAAPELEEPGKLWRTVGIDTLGPIGMEIDECRRQLRSIHLQLKRKSMPKNLWPDRFPDSIPTRAAAAPQGNSYLKALLVLARHMPPGDFDPHDLLLADQVAKDVGVYPASARFPRWMYNFYEGMANAHLPLAFAMVQRLYKWLIHAQLSLGAP
ncbi:transcriptional regulator domain-containing protein [Cupriavidus sp. 8B]